MSGDATNKLCLKTIHELLGEQFYIPAYQRGYRWSTLQVRELLDDIWEFSQSEDQTSTFYCLQPVVVVLDDDRWEVVDGQQRLTTLYVILHYLEKEHLRRELKEAYKKSLFSIEYETRPESAKFLTDIQAASSSDNIDFHFITKAYEEVERWFGEKDYNESNDFLGVLLAKLDATRSVQVIWYDLSEECEGSDYAVDVFSRINIGKIPLTNAELVKALFLKSSNFKQEEARLKQIQIAMEWDAIEKSLQDPSFWYFICREEDGRHYDSRIEYIFDLMQGKKPGAEPFFTFHKFNLDFIDRQSQSESNPVDSIWREIKDYFLTFDEWYRDRELFHLIGFLVECGESVRGLKEKSAEAGLTKTEFKAFLRRRIRRYVNFQLDELNYGDRDLKRIFLLFNIQTLLATKEADVRFPFDRYKLENWDIEHIRSQTDKEISGKARVEWAEDVLEYFTATRIPSDIDLSGFSKKVKAYVKRLADLLSAKSIDDEQFKELYQNIAAYFGVEEGSDLDGVGNLTLLDMATNRSYKNAMFPIKRKRIIQNDMNGIFVPICTKNVFLKFYSKKLGKGMYWTESDAADYVSAIKGMLSEYLPVQGTANE